MTNSSQSWTKPIVFVHSSLALLASRPLGPTTLQEIGQIISFDNPTQRYSLLKQVLGYMRVDRGKRVIKEHNIGSAVNSSCEGYACSLST